MSNLYALHKAIEVAHMNVLLPTATSHSRFQEIFKHHAPLQRNSDDALERLPDNLTEAVQDIAKQMSIHVDSYIDSHEYGTAFWAEHVLSFAYHYDELVCQ